MDCLFVVGSSGHAGVVIDIVEQADRYRIAGLLDDFAAAGETRHGYPVLGRLDELPRLSEEHGAAGIIVAIGDNFARGEVVCRVARLAPKLPFVSAVHPAATLARRVEIGPGAAVMAGAGIGRNSVVGAHCVVNSAASVDHDNVLERFSSVGPGAVTGGRVRIAEFGVVALGARVLEGRRIGAHAVLGASATATHDIPDGVVAYGTPARVVRSRQPGDRYL
jgi:sugar O-acyltransferase (sialic acid O-acetyltransferase NeuD family)